MVKQIRIRDDVRIEVKLIQIKFDNGFVAILVSFMNRDRNGRGEFPLRNDFGFEATGDDVRTFARLDTPCGDV